jgi:hypothetical protein
MGFKKAYCPRGHHKRGQSKCPTCTDSRKWYHQRRKRIVEKSDLQLRLWLSVTRGS